LGKKGTEAVVDPHVGLGSSIAMSFASQTMSAFMSRFGGIATVPDRGDEAIPAEYFTSHVTV